MKNFIKAVIKWVFPCLIYKVIVFCYTRVIFYFWVFYAPFHNWKNLQRIKKKEIITVLFLPANLAMWKYDYLFELMQKHPCFNPVILISLPLGISQAEREKMRIDLVNHFNEKGFPMVENKDMNPDLVFITQGYEKFSDFGMGDFPNSLGCYAPYSYATSCISNTMNLLELNKVWRYFEITKKQAQNVAPLMSNRGRNVYITGYANADYFLDSNKKFMFPWKESDSKKKKIIYAPHWAISSSALLKYSTFMKTGELMLSLAKKYADKTQWVFKPHPWLYRELCKFWGEAKANAYYDAWKNLPNATCEFGSYIDLFMTSDAMIHDSSSFRSEYFYTQKPVMHLVIDDPTGTDGEIGKIAFNTHYHGHNAKEIEAFIIDVVLGGNDPKARERKEFYDKYLLPPNGKTAAQNILDEIERGLGWK